MTRTHVAVLAVRVAALWLVTTGLVGCLSLLVVRIPAPYSDVTMPTLLLFGVIPVATGLLIWSFGPPIAIRTFKDRGADGLVNADDLYRVAAVFTGLGLLGKAVPAASSLLCAWLVTPTSRSTVLDMVGPRAHHNWTLIELQTASATIATLAQVVLGAVLLTGPSIVEKLPALRRQPPVTEEQASETRG